MRGGRGWFCGAVLGVVVGVAGCGRDRPAPPDMSVDMGGSGPALPWSWQGRKPAEWMARLDLEDVEDRRAAHWALGEIAPAANAIEDDVWTKGLADPEDGVRIATLRSLWRLGGVPDVAWPGILRALHGGDATMERLARGILRVEGGPSLEVLRTLVAGEERDLVRDAASRLLGTPEGIGILRQRLAGTSGADPVPILRALGDAGESGVPLAEAVVPFLGTPGSGREAAVAALTAMGAPALPVLDRWIAALPDTPEGRKARQFAAFVRLGLK